MSTKIFARQNLKTFLEERTFLSPQVDDPVGKRKSTQTGPFQGLTLVLNVEQEYYMIAGQSPDAGARVAVHSSNKESFILEAQNKRIDLSIQSRLFRDLYQQFFHHKNSRISVAPPK